MSPRKTASDVTVFLGRQQQQGTNPNEVSRSVTQIINHPDYNDQTFDNDISLLKLSSSVAFTNFILPVCLAAADSTFHNGTDSWVTGWGSIGSEGGSGTSRSVSECLYDCLYDWQLPIRPTICTLVQPPIRVKFTVKVKVRVEVRGGWTTVQFVRIIGGRTNSMPPSGMG